MNDLQQKHDQAQADYETARAKLDSARSVYEDVAGKAFSDAKNNRETIVAQLDADTQARESAKAALTAAMQESKGARTPEVSQALSARRDADDLIEQHNVLLAAANQIVATTQADASVAAQKYINAYETAAQRWAEVNMLAALVACGETLARAMAVKAPDKTMVPYPIRYERGTSMSTTETCEQFVVRELRALAVQFDAQPYTPELGTVDLGGLAKVEILSPAQLHALKTDPQRTDALIGDGETFHIIKN